MMKFACALLCFSAQPQQTWRVGERTPVEVIFALVPIGLRRVVFWEGKDRIGSTVWQRASAERIKCVRCCNRPL